MSLVPLQLPDSAVDPRGRRYTAEEREQRSRELAAERERADVIQQLALQRIEALTGCLSAEVITRFNSLSTGRYRCNCRHHVSVYLDSGRDKPQCTTSSSGQSS